MMPNQHHFHRLGRQLWRDETGATMTIELVFMVVVLVIGSLAGLAAFRDSVSQEFGDASAGLASIDQSYQFDDTTSGGTIDNMQFSFQVLGSNYVDEPNFCEPAVLDPVGDAPMCMQFSAANIADEG